MEIQNHNKISKPGLKILLILLGLTIAYFIVSNINSDPFESIKEMRKDIVTDYELLKMNKTELGTMLYSVGKVNNGDGYMYFVDMVKKSFLAYKWIGGGGHISRDYLNENNFIFSTQLLNEKQNIKPTIFGVFFDENIEKITVSGDRNKTHVADIYKGKGTNEMFYVISFDEAVSGYNTFIYTVKYKNGERAGCAISEEIERLKLQKGVQKYIYQGELE